MCESKRWVAAGVTAGVSLPHTGRRHFPVVMIVIAEPLDLLIDCNGAHQPPDNVIVQSDH